MAKRDQNDNTGRTVAIVGGGALLAWLLLRGKGWAFGSGDGDGDGEGGDQAGGASAPASSPAATVPAAPCRVHIGKLGIRLDGSQADLPRTIATCRASGTADVTSAGDAIVQVVADTVHALQDAGILVRAAPEVWSTANGTPRKP